MLHSPETILEEFYKCDREKESVAKILINIYKERDKIIARFQSEVVNSLLRNKLSYEKLNFEGVCGLFLVFSVVILTKGGKKTTYDMELGIESFALENESFDRLVKKCF